MYICTRCWVYIKSSSYFEAILAHSFTLAKYTMYLGCSSTQFRCSNGQCISPSFRCNGRSGGCSDRSDERNCCKFPWTILTVTNLYLNMMRVIIYTVSYQNGAFRCSNGTCISSSRRCDGTVHCIDDSDETGCGSKLSIKLGIKEDQI